MAILQLIRCMSLHAMALSALSSFPVRSRGKKPSLFILQCRQLETPCGDTRLQRLWEGSTPLHPTQHSPALSQTAHSVSAKPRWHLTTRGRAGGTSPPHRTAPFTPAVMSLHLFPPELGAIFPFTTVMKLQSEREGFGKQRSF